MTETNPTQKCIYSRHSGPVGCLPALNIFPLANETFAKGKMFWNWRYTHPNISLNMTLLLPSPDIKSLDHH